VVDVDDGGVPTFISGRLGQVASLAGGTPDVMPLLAQIAKVFRASPADLTLRTTINDPETGDHFRFSQTKNGLRVLGGELILHVKGGLVFAANGSARHDLVTPAAGSAKIDATTAITAAKNDMAAVAELAVADGPELAYLPGSSKMELVYVVKATGVDAEGVPVQDDVLVSSVDGSIRGRIPHIHTALNRERHTGTQSNSRPGATVGTETPAPVADAVINTNFDRLGDTYDCYKDLYGRDSFDGAGAKMISTVHHQVQLVNVFWNGS
jgi:vibriolysin